MNEQKKKWGNKGLFYKKSEYNMVCSIKFTISKKMEVKKMGNCGCGSRSGTTGNKLSLITTGLVGNPGSQKEIIEHIKIQDPKSVVLAGNCCGIPGFAGMENYFLEARGEKVRDKEKIRSLINLLILEYKIRREKVEEIVFRDLEEEFLPENGGALFFLSTLLRDEPETLYRWREESYQNLTEFWQKIMQVKTAKGKEREIYYLMGWLDWLLFDKLELDTKSWLGKIENFCQENGGKFIQGYYKIGKTNLMGYGMFKPQSKEPFQLNHRAFLSIEEGDKVISTINNSAEYMDGVEIDEKTSLFIYGDLRKNKSEFEDRSDGDDLDPSWTKYLRLGQDEVLMMEL